MEHVMPTIRRERPGDEVEIYDVNLRAFGRVAEPEVVDMLRKTCPEGVSFVAEEGGGRIVGHILFTPAVIEGDACRVTGAGLAPLAVVPEFQRQGVGSALVAAGLEEMKRAGQPFVVLVGHPDYYPRFGFVRASQYGIRPEYEEVPDEAFMIIVFDEGTLQGITGVAHERSEFAAAM
jgi:putative acetyltransferase